MSQSGLAAAIDGGVLGREAGSAEDWSGFRLSSPQPKAQPHEQNTEHDGRGAPERGRTGSVTAPRPANPAQAHRNHAQTLRVDETRTRWGQAFAWGGTAFLVAGLHLCAAYVLTRVQIQESNPPIEKGAIMIDLAPEVQQAASQIDAALAKPEEQAEPVPPEPAPPEEAEAPTQKDPDLPVEALAPLPPPRESPKPVPKKPAPPKPPERKPPVRRKPALRTASAPRSQQHAAATTATSAGMGSTLSPADWKSLVSAALNRHKRFPPGVSASGSPTLRISIAASGHVVAATVIASSGVPELDAAAIQTVQRASPLPPPPAGAQTLTFRMNFRSH